MKNMFPSILLFASTLTVTLTAGLFYAYSCSVNPGLGRLDDAGYLSAMQSINSAILNPVFFICFMGAALLLPLATFFHYYGHPVNSRFWCVLAASLLYIIGVVGITGGGNVPLNNMLAAADLNNASAEQLQLLRKSFEQPWNYLHTIRTVIVVFTAALLIATCIWTEQPS